MDEINFCLFWPNLPPPGVKKRAVITLSPGFHSGVSLDTTPGLRIQPITPHTRSLACLSRQVPYIYKGAYHRPGYRFREIYSTPKSSLPLRTAYPTSWRPQHAEHFSSGREAQTWKPEHEHGVGLI